MQEHIDYLYDEKWRHQFWLYIVHLHGSYTGHDFVLSPDDHNRSLQRNQIVTLLQALVNRRSIVRIPCPTCLHSQTVCQTCMINHAQVMIINGHVKQKLTARSFGKCCEKQQACACIDCTTAACRFKWSSMPDCFQHVQDHPSIGILEY